MNLPRDLQQNWLDKPGRFVWIMALALGFKVLVARQFILGHAFGFGAIVDLIFVAGIAVFFSLFRGRGVRLLLVSIDLVLSIVFIGITLYTSTFDQIPSAQSFAFSKQAAELGPAVLTLLSWRYILLLVDVPFMFWLAFRERDVEHEPQWGWRVAFSASSAALVGVFSVTMAVLPVTGGNLVASYWYGLVPNEIAVSFLSPIAPKTTAPTKTAELQAKIDSLTGRVWGERKVGAPAAGAYKGCNLIMIQVEALQRGVVGGRVEGQQITPNLDALISRSYYLPNTYSQIGPGNTSDAEFISNTSLYPSHQAASCLEFAKKKIPGLPRILGEMGYTTITFHTNDASFWNRFQLYPALGFSDYADKSYFGNGDTIGMGASDQVLFDRSLPVIVSSVKEGKPVYAQLITLSSHYPYGGIDGRSPLHLSPETANTITGKYLMAEAYADQQIGNFISNLEDAGLLDNSIVVIYGDHFGMRFENTTPADAELRRQLLGRDYNKADFYNIPLIVHLPKQTKPVVDPGVTGQIDIMPSVADLLGASLKGIPHFGRSVFVRTPTLITRPSSVPTYIDDRLVYLGGVDGGEDRWYSPTTQTERQSGTVPKDLANVTQLTKLSEAYTLGLPQRLSSLEATGVVPSQSWDVNKTPWR
jgi:phosphoglycerol transferase MdoB-like AlkP superfamily enzyme